MFRKYMPGLRFSKKEISRSITVLSIFFIISSTGCNEKPGLNQDDYYSEAALKSNREEFLFKTINETIKSNLTIPLSDSTEKKYQSAFWAMELVQYKNGFTDSVITSCFLNLKERTSEFQRSFLELVYTLYQNKYAIEVETFAEKTDNPKLFAMCTAYLKKSGYDLEKSLTNYIKRNPDQSDHPIIVMLTNEISLKKFSLPPLEDLLEHNFNNKVVIFSIQRTNRNYPGLAIFRKSDGKFLRNESGEIFSVSQLARAITDLPGYITNGNTPEGIFSIQGIGSSKNIFIGPSPNLQLVLPFEVNPLTFFHNQITDSSWNEELYNSLLPASWKNYIPIHTTYYAGKAGRTEIIAHGTTIDPGFYNGKSYFPYTPSLGCLTTKEIWSNENGKLIESDQIKFMNAIKLINAEEGFFIVVDIDNQNSAVNLTEIKSIILEAEK